MLLKSYLIVCAVNLDNVYKKCASLMGFIRCSPEIWTSHLNPPGIQMNVVD